MRAMVIVVVMFLISCASVRPSPDAPAPKAADSPEKASVEAKDAEKRKDACAGGLKASELKAAKNGNPDLLISGDECVDPELLPKPAEDAKKP